MTIPYAAVVYDSAGKTWAYVNEDPLVYKRAEITVDEIDGDVARLTAGPPAGTQVVTTGAAELYGAEIGVGGGPDLGRGRADIPRGRPTMMRRIIATSLRFRFIVVALAAGLLIFGATQVRAMPVDVFPEFAPPKVEIQTICIGLSAEEVEQLVTVPIEQSLAGIEGLETIRSKSVIQLSQVVLLFGRDQRAQGPPARRRELAQITPSLPTWAAPPVMLQPLSATSRVMKIGLSSDTVSQIDMSMISYWTIRPRLLSVKGVANIAIWGEQLDMLTVQAVPSKMVEKGVALTSVMDAVSETLDDGLLQFNAGNFTGTGGFVDTPNQRLVIRHPAGRHGRGPGARDRPGPGRCARPAQRRGRARQDPPAAHRRGGHQ